MVEKRIEDDLAAVIGRYNFQSAVNSFAQVVRVIFSYRHSYRLLVVRCSNFVSPLNRPTAATFGRLGNYHTMASLKPCGHHVRLHDALVSLYIFRGR
jgi:hypothetical protein